MCAEQKVEDMKGIVATQKSENLVQILLVSNLRLLWVGMGKAKT